MGSENATSSLGTTMPNMKFDLKIEHHNLKIEYYIHSSSVRNKGQKLVGRFLENQTFCRFFIGVPLKMYSKFGRPKWILVSQMLKLGGKWPVASCYF